MKIAIFGGSFNPVHNEHKNLISAAIESLRLEKVIIMPTHITPFKNQNTVAEDGHRLNMCRIAFSGVKEAEISDCEILRGGVSYSYLTCEEIRKKYPQDELFFIVGGDMLKNFPDWKNPQRILNSVKLAACARECRTDLKNSLKKFKSVFGFEPLIFNYVGGKVSSSKIRALAALGEDVSHLTGSETAKYIKDNGLYLMPGICNVKNMLTPDRWAHTVRVAVMAAENCRRINVSERSAIIAAALHDCAKYLKKDSPQLKGFTFPQDVPEPVVHQYAGAFVAEHTFGIVDNDILNAIRYHASGRENMSGIEKLLYLCDMLEEGRNFNGVENLRKLFYKDIDGCLSAALEHNLNYLNSYGNTIYPLTQKAYGYLKENL